MFSQLLFSVSVVPSDWKSAVITPVYKKGVAGKVCNYRPISLTCVPIMERVIARQMYEHLKAHGILHRAQLGFCNGRSTCTNLLESINDWTLSIEYKHSVKVAYVDFKTTFKTTLFKNISIQYLSSSFIFHLLQTLFCFFLMNLILSFLLPLPHLMNSS